jgi:hypothetical protein
MVVWDQNVSWGAWQGGEWNEFNWLRIGAGGGLCECGDDYSCSDATELVRYNCSITKANHCILSCLACFLIQWRTYTRFSVRVNAIHMHGNLIIYGPISRFYEPWYAHNVVLCVVTNIWDERVL